MKCKSCGVSLKVDAKFCGKCGAPVEATEPDGVRCPKCGTVNRAGAKFCQRDGTALQSPDQPRAEVRSATASVPEHTAVEAHEIGDTLQSDTRLRADTVPGTAGAKDVIVATAAGNVTCTGCLTYDDALVQEEYIEEQ